MAHPPGQPLVLPGQEEGLKAGGGGGGGGGGGKGENISCLKVASYFVDVL